MKANIQIQFNYTNVNVKDIEKRVKEDLKSKGVTLNTIKDLEIYYKIEENAIYYVYKTKNNKIAGTGNVPIIL